ncbi:MAG: class I SAM-dependent methyltransferase [Candidatus Rokubacteria bacterium]|nr:class I SAM-dependent methyltransferase [Candidatus Rokubacteria bacterium]
MSKDAAYYRRFYEEQSEFRRRLTIPMLQVLAEFASTGQILDVGCGLGFFLDVASRHGGYRCVGIDMSTAATDFARCTLGLDVRTGDFSKERFAEVFDAITMNHVLEHISAPVPFLERARTVLAPGGIVVSSSPNFAGWLARALGARWYGLQPSQHVWQFTPASYATLFRRAGFSVLAVRTGSLYYPWGPGWKAPAVWGVARAAAILGHGDNMFLVARRP